MTRRLVVLLATLGLVATGVAPAGAAADDTVLHGARVVDLGPGLTSTARYTVLALEVDLSDPQGLTDQLSNFEIEPYPVGYASIDATGFVEPTTSDRLATEVEWDVLDRVAGSSTEGTWRGVVTVSSVSTGRVALDGLSVGDDAGNRTRVVPASPVTVDLPTTAASAPWAYRPSAVVEVVTGQETWRPQMLLTTRSGVPVAGAATALEYPEPRDGRWYGLPGPLSTSPQTSGYAGPSGPDGVIEASRDYPVGRRPSVASMGGYGRGTARHYTLMALGVVTPLVKWQARSSFSAGPGEVITLSGNAFPASSLYRAANPRVHLQRLVGRTWRTEATGTVRANGRFTVVWDAPDAAGYWVRAYKPGGADANGESLGTVGPHVWVATP